MTFLTAFRQFVREKALFTEKDALLIAVSGGVDSVVLVHLLAESGYTFSIAHCNFQLRGNESDQDEAFVKQLAESLKVPFFLKHFDTQQEKLSTGESIQMLARRLRYEWFSQLKQQHAFAFVATAHHQNDLIETVLLNLVRGTGLAGFHGIKARNQHLVRPLLFASKESIHEYASQLGLSWREDSSNQQDKYARNLIRHQIVPVLKQLNSSLEETLVHTTEKVLLSEHFIEHMLNEKRVRYMRSEKNMVYVDCLLSDDPDALYVLDCLLKPYSFSWPVVKEILQSANKESGKLFLSPTHRLLKDRGDWIIKKGLAEKKIHINLTAESADYQPSDEAIVDVKLHVGGIEKISEIQERGTLLLDFHTLTFPLLLRSWKHGDVFVPFGTKGRKKVSDFLIDRKVPLFEKEQVMVLESAGQIVALLGHEVGQPYVLTSSTSKIFKVSLHYRFPEIQREIASDVG